MEFLKKLCVSFNCHWNSFNFPAQKKDQCFQWTRTQFFENFSPGKVIGSCNFIEPKYSKQADSRVCFSWNQMIFFRNQTIFFSKSNEFVLVWWKHPKQSILYEISLKFMKKVEISSSRIRSNDCSPFERCMWC